MRWGMPPPPRGANFPVTNIRNTSSPHWRAWLKPENRCLVPANSFAEYAPEPNRETNWFGRNLRSAVPGLNTARPEVEGRRIMVYRGVSIETPNLMGAAGYRLTQQARRNGAS
jgi:putative SOS response-associated peptidase YedK